MKLVVISDTHGQHESLDMPKGDMLIHCGDFSFSKQSITNFLIWFSSQNYKYKILVAGNHDGLVEEIGKKRFKKMCHTIDKDIIYLEDESVEIEGHKIYGSPWTPEFMAWSFMAYEDDLYEKWKKIPKDTTILITHGPEKDVLDKVGGNGFYKSVGSSALKNILFDLKEVKYHLFGHIHNEAGIKEADEYKPYVSVNAASVYDSVFFGIKKPIVLKI